MSVSARSSCATLIFNHASLTTVGMWRQASIASARGKPTCEQGAGDAESVKQLAGLPPCKHPAAAGTTVGLATLRECGKLNCVHFHTRHRFHYIRRKPRDTCRQPSWRTKGFPSRGQRVQLWQLAHLLVWKKNQRCRG